MNGKSKSVAHHSQVCFIKGEAEMASWINQECTAYWKPPQHKTNASILIFALDNTHTLPPSLFKISVRTTAEESKVVNEKFFVLTQWTDRSEWVAFNELRKVLNKPRGKPSLGVAVVISLHLALLKSLMLWRTNFTGRWDCRISMWIVTPCSLVVK